MLCEAGQPRPLFLNSLEVWMKTAFSYLVPLQSYMCHCAIVDTLHRTIWTSLVGKFYYPYYITIAFSAT